MYKLIIIAFIGFFYSPSLLGQKNDHYLVQFRDRSTSNPLIGVHIYSEESGLLIATSDSNGRAFLPYGNVVCEKQGYTSATFHELRNILWLDRSIVLDEVLITANCPSRKAGILTSKKDGVDYLSRGNFNCLLIENNVASKRLLSLSYYVVKVKRTPAYNFRLLLIYNIESKLDSFFVSDIFKMDTIYIDGENYRERRGWNKIDLRDYGIILESQSILVGFQKINAEPVNYSKDSRKPLTSYIGLVYTDKFSSFFGDNGKFYNSELLLYNNQVNPKSVCPMINIELSNCN